MKAGRGAWVACAIVFCMVLYLAWLVPLHSDDFSYHNMGLTWMNHVMHYTHWSGRFLADYISAGILYLDSSWCTAALKAGALVAAIYMISRMPAIWLGTQPKTELFVFLLALYLSGNLILGQTVLWTVGAANYLFPVFFAVLYLFLFSLYCNRPAQKWRYFFLLCLTGLLAGCSNENTGWVMVAATLAGAVYMHWRHQDRAVWLLLVPVLLGFGVLLLSPGNAARAAHPAFAEFYQTHFLGRILRFTFSGGFPKSVAKLLPFWGAAAVLLAVGRRAAWSRPCRWAALIAMAFAFASAYSMVMSPAFPSRALSGPVFFMLIAVAFAYTPLVSSAGGGFLRWRVGFIAVSVLVALLAYVALLFSYQRIALQEEVRLALIKQAVSHGRSIAEVPVFFYPASLRNGDAVNSYHNEIAMGEHYGMSEILAVPLDYDYSVILDGEGYPAQAASLGETSIFDTLFLGRSSIRGGTTAVLVGPEIPSGNFADAQLRIVFTLRDGRQESRAIPFVLHPAPEGQMAGVRLPWAKADITGLTYQVILADGTESTIKGSFALR